MTKTPQRHDVIVVGGGIAGLTATAYLTAYGHDVLLIEKASYLGGNIQTFPYMGHHIDGGIRSIESSGVLKPMIKDLSLDVELVKSDVTLGIKDSVISLKSIEDIPAYRNLLIEYFPDHQKAIDRITKSIIRILKYMDVLYGIDNPMMMDLKKNKSYVIKTLMPWFFKFVPTLVAIERLHVPVEDYLRRFTDHQPLIDIIAQHFFKATPTFFALGYFSIYFDYHYPKGGTGRLIDAMASYITRHHRTILKDTKIETIDAQSHMLTDDQGNIYNYKHLVWAADLKALYRGLAMPITTPKKVLMRIHRQKHLLLDKKGAESVLTVYAVVDLPPTYFEKIASGHFFYTPKTDGLDGITLGEPKDESSLFERLKTMYDLNTYEISIPALRDPAMSPEGETALIISILMHYQDIKWIADQGYYDAFKTFTETYFIKVLSESIYPKLDQHVKSTFTSTPLTFEKRTGSSDGAIIGWAYDNHPIPVEHRMAKITKSINTPIPDVYQAGQWSFSPAGVPISILTGKLSADRINKRLKPSLKNISKESQT